MSLEDLEVGGLYVLLFIRGDPPVRDDFHWGLYLHSSFRAGGTKYHIKEQGAGWITDHGATRGVSQAFLLVGLFQIASAPPGSGGYVDGVMRTYDDSLNTLAGINCRVWIIWVLELLQKPKDGYPILKCRDLNALEAEIKTWGNEHARSAAANEQPRPISRSNLCEL